MASCWLDALGRQLSHSKTWMEFCMSGMITKSCQNGFSQKVIVTSWILILLVICMLFDLLIYIAWEMLIEPTYTCIWFSILSLSINKLPIISTQVQPSFRTRMSTGSEEIWLLYTDRFYFQGLFWSIILINKWVHKIRAAIVHMVVFYSQAAI